MNILLVPSFPMLLECAFSPQDVTIPGKECNENIYEHLALALFPNLDQNLGGASRKYFTYLAVKLFIAPKNSQYVLLRSLGNYYENREVIIAE